MFVALSFGVLGPCRGPAPPLGHVLTSWASTGTRQRTGPQIGPQVPSILVQDPKRVLRRKAGPSDPRQTLYSCESMCTAVPQAKSP